MTYATATTSDFKIYVADLAAYNSGMLHGVWIELDSYNDADDIQSQIDEMLKDSPVEDAEEWQIHDYEGFYGLKVSNYSIATLVRIVEIIEDENVDAQAFIYLYGNHDSSDPDDVYKDFQEYFVGVYSDKYELINSYLDTYADLKNVQLFGSNIHDFLDYDSIYSAIEDGNDIERHEEGLMMFINY